MCALDEVALDLAKHEGCDQRPADPFVIQMILAGEDVGAHEAASREGMHAEVTLSDQHEAGDAAGVLLVLRAHLDQARLDQLAHPEHVRQLVEPGSHHLGIAQPFGRAVVTVQSQVQTEPAGRPTISRFALRRLAKRHVTHLSCLICQLAQ